MKSSNNSRRSFLKKTALGVAMAGIPAVTKAEGTLPSKALQTKLTKDYGFNVPIVSAGMAFIANANLAIAVSKAGAFGQMSGSGFPVDYLKSEIQKIKSALKGKPFGINFLPRFTQIEHIEVCIAEKVPVVVFFWDDVPDAYMKRLKENHIKVWIQIGSLAEAKVAVEAGADVLIVQGFEAGGHNRSSASVMSIVPNIKKAFPQMSLIAAGGIADGQGLAAALTLGADAVSVGTRFLATPESNAHPEYKRRVVAAEVHDTVHHNIFGFDFPDATVRGIRNKIVAEYEGKDYPPPYAGKKPEDFPIIGQSAMGPIRLFSGVLPTPETTGDFEQMSLLAGESVGLIKEIQPLAEIVSQMVKEAKNCLAKY
jgi:NAD(P)H-dependent flavin oxidoreductase YrpB (nitropropane dioxygenase family)